MPGRVTMTSPEFSPIQLLLTELALSANHELSLWLSEQKDLGAEFLPTEDASWTDMHQILPVTPRPVHVAQNKKQPEQSVAHTVAMPPGRSMPSSGQSTQKQFQNLRNTTPARQTQETRQTALHQLNARIEQCRKCPLRQISRGVFTGRGSLDAEIMFIAAGANPKELQLNRFLSGDGAILFDTFIAELETKFSGITQRIYTTKVIKCAGTPPRQQQGEIAFKCQSYLREEIAYVNPKVIVVFGALAYRAIFKEDADISQIRGTRRQIDGIPTLVTHHPYEIVKNRSLAERTRGDLALAMQMLKR